MTEGAWYTDLDAFLKQFGGSRTVYNRFRIPKPPPAADDVSQPGRLCWGSVGALPNATPVPMVSFNVVTAEETHTELERKSTNVRITNPDDPTGQTYVVVDRADEILFKKNHKTRDGKDWTSSNTDGASDFGDFAPTPIELTSFKPLGTDSQSHVLVKFKNVPGSNQT
jgi:hypothetical protein